jgi:regulatory protein
MRRWGLSDADARDVLERLVRERFIDDSRYAEAYVREKMRFSGWGERKIRAALRMKAIAPNIIDRALEQLVPEDDTSRLEEVLRKKAARTTARDLYDLKGKLVRFGMSRGFDLDDVLAITEQILRERE